MRRERQAAGNRAESMVRRRAAMLLCSLLCVFPATAFAQEALPVSIRVDAGESLGGFRQIWRFFGADEPNYATMKDGQKLMKDYGSLRPGEVFFRGHNLLTSGDGTPALKWGSTNAYTEDADGNAIYDWRILDLMFDSYLERGVRPYVEIGFMPKALSSRPEPYRHEWRPGLPYGDIFTGWSYPPEDYEKWEELVYQWTKLSVDRYGAEEVNQWYWQTWNEANIGGTNRPGYFTGSVEEFHRLHDHAIAGVRRALPSARVGGPDSAGSGGDWTRRFLEHCLYEENYATGEKGTPTDFVSFHAKGSPRWMGDHIRMGIANQLRAIDDGFRIVASYPELKDTPIIIGESDPEGCAACQGPQFSYRNGTMYSSYTAASFARKHDLADRHGVNFEGALSWAFTFEDQPYFAGFRQLASNGIPLPVFNVIRMYSRMQGERVATESSHAIGLDAMLESGVRESPDVAAIASWEAEANKLSVMVWHYHDADVAGPTAQVALAIDGLPGALAEAKVTHYRIDQEHSNAYAEWLRMGSPIAPNRSQYARLQQVSELQTLSDAVPSVAIEDGDANIDFALPRQAVSLIVIQW